jgi:CHAD domain-containing protein
VCHALPLAADKSDEDVEHVHRLRISVRRAVEALRVFGGLIDEARLIEFRETLRRIRLAADEARNWDVLAQRFSQQQNGGVSLKILDQINVRRQEVQQPIAAVHREIIADGFGVKIEQLIQEVSSHSGGQGKRRFGRQARDYLAPVVKKFFKAVNADPSNDESLHDLRIRGKKLRYTMEIVAVAFDSAFRKRLYPQVTLFQDQLGAVNDHATSKKLFGDWLSKTDDVQQRAFLEGLLMAEERATADLQAVFLSCLTPKVVSGLKRQFSTYC